MYVLLLDIAELPDAPANLSDLTANLDVAHERTGRAFGGGNPEVRFTGSWEHLVVLAARYAGDDYSDLPMYVKSITHVI